MAQHTATIANPPKPARPTRARRRLRELRPMLWFIPVLLLLLIVTLYPTLFVIWMSFQKTRFYELTGFVGLANYVDTLSSRAFWRRPTLRSCTWSARSCYRSALGYSLRWS